jgi:hypothetical protein
MGGASYYQPKIPSKQIVIQTKNFSTKSQKICQNLVQVYTPSINSVLKNDVNNNKLNSWFVTGLTDLLLLRKSQRLKVVLVFINIKMLIIKLVDLLV